MQDAVGLFLMTEKVMPTQSQFIISLYKLTVYMKQNSNIISSKNSMLSLTAFNNGHLIREDVLNLSKFFIQSGGTGNSWYILRFIVHLDIPANDQGQAQTDSFHTI